MSRRTKVTRQAVVTVLRGAQGTGKTTIARALAEAAIARGESAIVYEGEDSLVGIAGIARRVDHVLICHQYGGLLPKLPRGLRVQFILTCEVAP